MIDLTKSLIKRFPLYKPLAVWMKKNKNAKVIREWERQGKPVPPPHIIKQRTIRTYAGMYKLRVLVETGTYLGAMVEALNSNFDRIYSIELSKQLYQKAIERFKGLEHINIIQGDSAYALKRLVKTLPEPTLFWLDAHYSGGNTAKGEKDTPILNELEHILNAKNERNVIIIDDARCFGTNPEYPSIKTLSEYIISKKPQASICVIDDMIRVTPTNFNNRLAFHQIS